MAQNELECESPGGHSLLVLLPRKTLGTSAPICLPCYIVRRRRKVVAESARWRILLFPRIRHVLRRLSGCQKNETYPLKCSP